MTRFIAHEWPMPSGSFPNPKMLAPRSLLRSLVQILFDVGMISVGIVAFAFLALSIFSFILIALNILHDLVPS